MGKKQNPEINVLYQQIYQRIEEQVALEELKKKEAKIHIENSLIHSGSSILSMVTEGRSNGKEEFSAW